MSANDYWRLFIETGAPEAYLLYSRALKMEAMHVFDDKGAGTQSHGLQ